MLAPASRRRGVFPHLSCRCPRLWINAPVAPELTKSESYCLSSRNFRYDPLIELSFSGVVCQHLLVVAKKRLVPHPPSPGEFMTSVSPVLSFCRQFCYILMR